MKIPPFICTGFQHNKEKPLQEIIEANKNRFQAAYAVDGWLLTHAGCHIRLAQHKTDVVAIAGRLNSKMAEYIEKPYEPGSQGIFAIGGGRGGECRVGGIFWHDFKRETGLAPIKQIFGHTETPEPVVTKTYVALDTTNNKTSCWLYDTSVNELVCLDLPELKLKMQNNEPGLIAELPKDEQGPFTEYLILKSVPFMGGYWQADYRRWKRDPDGW
ncbi:MAG: hypothetical protein PHH28_06285 [Desulfuromonadaceae bacterium]|nr:hypothetical protein [Desulfuromonadaceae bacterium]